MTYRPRPFGAGPFSDDLYSQWDQQDLSPSIISARASVRPMPGYLLDFTISLQARSSARQRIVDDAIIGVGVLTGQSSSVLDARLFWEVEPPCETTWTPRPLPPFNCPDAKPWSPYQ